MVLEGASAAEDAFQDNSSLPTDGDRFSSNDSPYDVTRMKYNIDLSRLPQPIPLVAPLFGWTVEYRAQKIAQTMEGVARVVQRAVTQDEFHALAFHSAKATAIASWGAPLGFVAGTYRTYVTRASFSFPLLKPDLTRLDVNKFWHLSGPRAQTVWHALRLVSYVSFGSLVGSSVFGAYAATVAAVGERVDPRMKDIVEAISNMGTQTAMSRSRSRGTSPIDAQRSGDQDSSTDFMSTDSSAYRDDGSSNAQYRESGDVSAGTIQRNVTPQRAEPSMSQAQTNDYTSQSQDAQDIEWDDDASPTAGNGPMERGNSDDGGSAWDRLRRGGSAPRTPQVSSTQESERPSSRADRGDAWASIRGGVPSDNSNDSYREDSRSFAFSKGAEEQQLAKGEAQKDFDARVEKERHGADFEDSNTRWK